MGFTEPEDPAAIRRRLLSAVLRYKWAILGLTVAGTTAGVGLVRFMPASFRAQATVWIEATDRARVERGPIRPDQLLDSRGWIDLLKSYVLLDDVVRQGQLYLGASPADSSAFAAFDLGERFRPGEYRLRVSDDGRWVLTSAGLRVQAGGTGDSVGTAVGFAWLPPAHELRPRRTIAFQVMTPRQAAMVLADGLRARIDQQGTFLRVELDDSDPARAAHTLNAVIDRYVALAAELKREKLSELAKILDEQLRYAQRHLADAEIQLESFRVRTITLPSDRSTPIVPGLELTRNPVFTTFFDMKTELEHLRRERDALERMATEARASGLGIEGLATLGSVQRSLELSQALRDLTSKQAELRALRARYTDEHPPVRRLADEVRALERVTIPQVASNLAAHLAERERELAALIGSASGELRQIPPRAIEEARLRREVAIAENLYTTLQQRYEEARLAEASTIPDVRILDRAVPPESPLRDRLVRFLLLGFAAGLGFGVVGAMLLDRVDPRVRYPDQVTHELGLPILGALPHLRGWNGTGVLEPHADARHQVLEALRSLRLAVQYAYGTGPLILTVTSPGTRDGKSFLALNLALSFAGAGWRTLLVDGDVRRGGLHRPLKVSRRPGLTDHLAGLAPLEEVVRPTSHPSLWLIPSGMRTPEGPELLTSSALRNSLLALRGHWDVVLVDSPPLGAGADPYVLGIATGNVLLVLRNGLTDREFAQAKLELVDRLPIRLLGAVLNDVRPGGPYGYYHYYLPGYGVESEPRHEEVARKQLPNAV